MLGGALGNGEGVVRAGLERLVLGGSMVGLVVVVVKVFCCWILPGVK